MVKKVFTALAASEEDPSMQDRDHLWYDRAEPEEAPCLLLRTVAIVFVGALCLYTLPYRLCQFLGERLVRRVSHPDSRP